MNRALATVAMAVACTGQRAPERADHQSEPKREPSAAATPPAAPAAERSAPRRDGAAATAATALLDTAGAARGRLALAFDSPDRTDWHYVPRDRAGLAIGDMSEAQRRATWALLDTGLSRLGREKVDGILKIEPILGRLEGNPSFRDPGRYHVAIFGTPGAGAWGWRFEGHHLSLNVTLGREVATTPAFFGANPARVADGPARGLRVLAAEEDLGRALYASLTVEQRRRATFAASAPADIVTRASRRVALARFEGLPAADLTPEQRTALLRLIEVYAETFQPDFARAHLARIRAAGVERVYFAWAGDTAPGQSHYYRIHGPTHVIEYDNRGGDHIHTVFRDLEHDFGDGHLARHLRDHHGAK